MLITVQEQEDLEEIQELLDEAYDNFFEKDEDACCKSSEGYFEVHFHNYFDRREGGSGIASVRVYSYVFGTGRTHDFRSTRHAVETVRDWYAEEMARDYAEENR